MRFQLLCLNNRVDAKVSSLRAAATLIHASYSTGEHTKVRDKYFGILWNVTRDGYGQSIPHVEQELAARLRAKRNVAERKAGVPVTSYAY